FLDPVLLDHPAPTASYTLSLHDALPILIRYDTGDIGIMDIVDGSPVLTQVEGRKIDAVTNTKGEIISNNIMLLLNNYHELNQCQDRKSTRLNSSHVKISYAVFCLKKKNK